MAEEKADKFGLEMSSICAHRKVRPEEPAGSWGRKSILGGVSVQAAFGNG